MTFSTRAFTTVIGVGALVLTGCSSKADSSGGGDLTPADTTLSYSQPHTDPFQNAEMKGSMERFKELGYATIPATNSDRDASKQFTDIQTLINKGAKGLVISVGDADAIVPAIEYANDHKVPLVAIDEAPASGKIAMIVRADNVQLGALACEEMGKRVKTGSAVITLDGDPVTSNGRDRTNGFNDCMKSKYPGVKLVNIATQWDPAKAAAGIETAMNQYSNVAGIYNQSDATFFPTILDTLKTLGKLTPARPGRPHRAGLGRRQPHGDDRYPGRLPGRRRRSADDGLHRLRRGLPRARAEGRDVQGGPDRSQQHHREEGR